MAQSGAEARGEGATQNRPYGETFGYDGIGHLTERHTYQWTSPQMSIYDSYTNNRHDPVGSLWQYDADGRLLQMPNTAYTYDAAGSVDTVTSGTSTVLGTDGDGQQVKSTETVYDPQSGQTTTTTRYYVRSTVLAGEVLTEFEPANNYTETFVYLGGTVLATQQSNGIPWVGWEHRDPSNATYLTSDANNVRDRAELDPVGANMGLSDSTYTQSVPDEGSLSPYPSFSSGANLGTTYSWDGIPMPADEFFQMVGTLMHGPFGVVEASARASAPRLVSYSITFNDGHVRDFGLNLNEALKGAIEVGNLTRNWVVSDDWGLDYGLLPQSSGFKTGGPAFTAGQKKILDSSFNRINQDDCKNFINQTLADYKVGKGFNTLDKLLNRATFGYYDVNADYTNTDLGVDIDSTIGLRDAFVNRGASAVTTGDRSHIFLSDKVFERTDYYFYSRTADTPSYIVHELLHVAGIDKSIVDSQQMTKAIREHCRLLGSDPITLRH